MGREYTTVQGDMWDQIAYSQLGDVAHTGNLLNRNRGYLGYYIFPAGVVLSLPDIDPGVPDTLPPWKRALI